jgi:hypothetical protein
MRRTTRAAEDEEAGRLHVEPRAAEDEERGGSHAPVSTVEPKRERPGAGMSSHAPTKATHSSCCSGHRPPVSTTEPKRKRPSAGMSSRAPAKATSGSWGCCCGRRPPGVHRRAEEEEAGRWHVQPRARQSDQQLLLLRSQAHGVHRRTEEEEAAAVVAADQAPVARHASDKATKIAAAPAGRASWRQRQLASASCSRAPRHARDAHRAPKCVP